MMAEEVMGATQSSLYSAREAILRETRQRDDLMNHRGSDRDVRRLPGAGLFIVRYSAAPAHR